MKGPLPPESDKWRNSSGKRFGKPGIVALCKNRVHLPEKRRIVTSPRFFHLRRPATWFLFKQKLTK